MKKTFLILALGLITLLSACGGSENFTVSNVVYVRDFADPSLITAVNFDLDKPAEVVRVIVDGRSLACESANLFTHWTCPMAAMTLTKDTSMKVVALFNR